jgi:hypothetical protein
MVKVTLVERGAILALSSNNTVYAKIVITKELGNIIVAHVDRVGGDTIVLFFELREKNLSLVAASTRIYAQALLYVNSTWEQVRDYLSLHYH